METTTPTPTTRRAAVYRLYDAAGALLYIGSAYDPERRYVQHHAKHWWSQVARRTEEWHPSKPEAYAAEMAAIKVEYPVHNEMGTPRYVPPAVKAAVRLGRRDGELSLAQIAAKHVVSRQSLHAYRQRSSFPKPIPSEGTTRLRFRAEDVAAWFAANPPQQGKRTDLTEKPQQGESVVIEGQMGSQPLNSDDAHALLGIVWQWIENANNGLGSDVGDLMQALEDAGYGPPLDEEPSDG